MLRIYVFGGRHAQMPEAQGKNYPMMPTRNLMPYEYIGLGHRGAPSPDDPTAIQHLDAWSTQKGESHDDSREGGGIVMSCMAAIV